MQNIYTPIKTIQKIKTDSIIKRNIDAFEEKNKQLNLKQRLKNHISNYINYRKSKIKVKKLENIDFIGWTSDETQLNNQIPVLMSLNEEGYKTAILTNKKRIFDNLTSSGKQKVYFIPFSSLEISNEKNLKFIVNLFQNITLKSPDLKFALIGNDLRWDDRAVCLIFKELGIKTAVISHGLNIINKDVDKIICDKHFAWSEKEFQYIIKAGIPKEKVFLTGSPAMDQIINNASYETQKEVNSFIKNKIDSAYILVSFSGPGGIISIENHLKNIEFLKSSANIFKELNFKLVFKLHKKDNLKYYGNIFKNEIFIQIPQNHKELNTSIFPWIKHASAVISGPSGSIIDSMLLKTPAYYCDIMNEGTGIDFVKEGIVPVFDSSKALTHFLNLLQTNTIEHSNILSSQNEYIKTLFGDNFGKSSKKIINILLDESDK